MRHSSKKVEMFILLLLSPIMGAPIGSFLNRAVNRTIGVGHSLAYNIEQFRTHPERVLSPISDGELKLFFFVEQSSDFKCLTWSFMLNNYFLVYQLLWYKLLILGYF